MNTRLNKGLVVAVFAGLGPLIGCIGVIILAAIAWSGGINAFLVMPHFLTPAYAIGFGPALITGIVYAFLPVPLQRIVVAPFVGAISVWLFYELLDVFRSERGEWSNSIFLIASGAGAAFVCAIVVRVLSKLDARTEA